MKRRYTIEMIIGFVAYGLALVVLNAVYEESLDYKYALALLPLMPLIYTVTVIIRFTAELDEMYMRIVTEAMAFSGLATGFTCFSYLFLRDLGAPEFRAEWAFYVMWIYYALGLLWSTWRYQWKTT